VSALDSPGPAGRDLITTPSKDPEVRRFRDHPVAGAGAVVLALALSVASGHAQVPAELTLEDAVALAKGSSPTFLRTQNDQAAADWQVREAYAQFLPSLSVGMFGTWQQAGAQRFGTVAFQQNTDWYYSGYQVNLGLNIDGSTVFGIPQARANARATEASIADAEFRLESMVAGQYMAALRAQEALEVAQRRLERARQNLQIVQTRVATGAAAGTEGTQAEVDLGTAEVGLIQAERDLRQARLLLGEQIGIPMDSTVVLSSEFEIFEPAYDVDALIETALSGHPSLRASLARESATRATARQLSTSQYLPSLSVNATLSGQAQEAVNRDYVLQQLEDGAASAMRNCERNNAIHNGIAGGLPGYTLQDCSGFALDAADRQAALAANDVFPFDFNKNPARVTAQISLPIFTGFSRERQVSAANNAAEDAEHDRRAEELRLRTAVRYAYDNLVSAHRVVQREERNRALSEEQLQAEQRRYALGASSLLVLLDAQQRLSEAEQAYLNAVYDFHYNLIALEAAVGQPLRPN
jgi:outer membrane protein TolC